MTRTPAEVNAAWAAYASYAGAAFMMSGPGTVREQYEALRELYVIDAIDLPEFTAQVVRLLLAGL